MSEDDEKAIKLLTKKLEKLNKKKSTLDEEINTLKESKVELEQGARFKDAAKRPLNHFYADHDPWDYVEEDFEEVTLFIPTDKAPDTFPSQMTFYGVSITIGGSTVLFKEWACVDMKDFVNYIELDHPKVGSWKNMSDKEKEGSNWNNDVNFLLSSLEELLPLKRLGTRYNLWDCIGGANLN